MKTNYIPGSISFGEGFLDARGDVGFNMVADYGKAKSIIANLLSQNRNIENVQMGLDGDWDFNSNTIWENGEYFEYTSWHSSQWAEPIIIVNYSDGPSETYPVWTRQEKQKKQ